VPAVIIERERALRAEQVRIKTEREALERRIAEFEAAKAKPAVPEPTDPLDQLKHTREQVASLQQTLEAQAAAAKKAEEDRIWREWADKQVAAVRANAEKYELTILNGYDTRVPFVIEQHWRKTKEETGVPETLTPDQAAEKLEKELEAALEKNTASKKWKARTAAATPPPTAQPVAQPPTGAQTPPRTITNGLTGSTAASSSSGVLTKEQRIARAVEAAKRAQQQAK